MSKKATKPPPLPPPPPAGSRFGIRKLLAEISGARLCYGDPVRNGERVVIPVARVRGRGGGGYGRPADSHDDGGGGGGGGTFSAAPLGFINVGPEGASFEPIPDPETTARALLTGAAALTSLAGSLLWLRARSRRSALGGRAPRRLLRG